MHSHWEHFDHGADIGVRGFGPTEAAAFEQAALALTAVVADPDSRARASTAWTSTAKRPTPNCCWCTGSTR